MVMKLISISSVAYEDKQEELDTLYALSTQQV